MSTYKLKNFQNSLQCLNIFSIEPTYNIPNSYVENFATYIESIEKLLELILPKDIFADVFEDPSNENIKKAFSTLKQKLPIVAHSEFQTPPYCLSFSVLCEGDYTYGIGRFLADILCKWLIPGKQLALEGNRSINFQFTNFSKSTFYITEIHVHIKEEKELTLIKNNLENFIRNLKSNILAVQHARHVIHKKKLSNEEKSALIQENLSSLLESERKDQMRSAYDQMQNFLLKLSYEKNLSQIKDNLNRLMNKRPGSFDRDIYEAINYVSAVFRDNFTAVRDPHFVSRLIGYHYLFNKIIKQKIFSSPEKRHLSFKLLKTHLTDNTNNKTVIGILIAMNLLQETERFEQKHLIQAIKSCVGEVKFIKNSFISDKREQNVLLYYLEVEKQNDTKFSLEDIKILSKKLPSEIKSRIENVINPIFMPRNEEEILRNIILLSKQIKYVRDIPQLIISYDKQTGTDISFLVILVRLLKSDSPPLKEFFCYSQTFLKYIPEEVKIIGALKKKYPKEANIFRVSLNKSPFYRKDYSLDLQKARQIVVAELAKIIGDFRDYNGGMIHKQTQALDILKQELPNIGKDKEFLIENFFYSLKPGIMQSILDSNTLKTFFLLFLQILEERFTESNFTLKTLSMPKYILLMVGSLSSSYKERVQAAVNKLRIPSFDLTSCFMQEEGISALGFVYRTNNLSKHSHFYHCVLNEMNEWNNTQKHLT